jgi:hydrogenase maturation protease
MLVAGLGSPHGDDQLGWAVVDRLRSRLPAGVPACKVSGGLDLLARLEGHDEAILVDASAPAGRPGTIRAFDWPCDDFAEGRSFSTHGLGLVAALRLAEALGRPPRRVHIVAVEAQETAPGADLSGAVARRLEDAAGVVLAAVRRYLEAGCGEEGPCTRRP